MFSAVGSRCALFFFVIVSCLTKDHQHIAVRIFDTISTFFWIATSWVETLDIDAMPVLLDFVPTTFADLCLPVYDDHFIGNLKINQDCSFTEFTDMVQEYLNDDYNSLLSVLHAQDMIRFQRGKPNSIFVTTMRELSNCRYIYLLNVKSSNIISSLSLATLL